MKKFDKRWRILFAPLIVIALIGFGYITMFLWNVLMPVIFKLPLITFWQAVGLLILSRLIIGFGHGHRRDWGYRQRAQRIKEKWGSMSPEEREKFGHRFGYCGYNSPQPTADSPQQ